MPTHKQPESERFKGPAKYVEYLFGRALVKVLQHLPIKLAYPMGRAAGWLAWKLMSRRRDIVRKNLEIVNSWLREDPSRIKDQVAFEMPIEEQVREVFRRSCANLFSGFTFSLMTAEQAQTHIQIEGIEHLNAALKTGKGAVVLLPHMGPWEALAQLPGLARKYGIEAPFGAVYRPMNNTYFDEWYRTQREASGMHLFGSRYKFYAPVDFVRAGGMLGVLSDQRASGGEQISYFGRLTHATPLPGLLFMRSKAGLLSLSIATVAKQQWRIRISSVQFESVESGQRRSHVAQETARAMELALGDSPLDGFWFHDRFKKSRKEHKNSELAQEKDVARVGR